MLMSTMRRVGVISLSLALPLTAACAMTAHERDGMKYLHAQAGLGVGDDSGTVPNIVEFELPLAYAKVTSPLGTELAKIALGATDGILSWALGGIAELLGIDK